MTPPPTASTEELTIRLWERITRTVRWQFPSRPQEWEDLTNDTWLALVREAQASGQWIEPLTVAIVHRALDSLRRLQRAQRPSQLLEHEAVVPADTLAGKVRVTEILERVELTPLESRVLYYYFFLSYSLGATSHILTESIEKVKSAHHTAIAKLRLAAEDLLREEEQQ